MQQSEPEENSKNNQKCIPKQRKRQIQNALLKAAKDQFLLQKQSQYNLQRNYRTKHSRNNQCSNESNQQQCYELVAPISPSPSNLISRVLDQLKQSHQIENPLLLDFGVGDGRWIISAHESNLSYRCIGYDIDNERILLARENIKKYLQKIKFSSCVDPSFTLAQSQKAILQIQNKDVFQILQDRNHTEVDRAQVMIFYLFREAMIKISNLLKQRNFQPVYKTNDKSSNNLKKIVQIVSVGFALPCWSPPIWYDTICGINVYVYHSFQNSDEN